MVVLFTSGWTVSAFCDTQAFHGTKGTSHYYSRIPFIHGSHHKSDKKFPDSPWFFPWPEHKFPWPFSAFCKKFYLEHEMIIATFFRWKSQLFCFNIISIFFLNSLTFRDILEKQKSSLTFLDHFIFHIFPDFSGQWEPYSSIYLLDFHNSSS